MGNTGVTVMWTSRKFLGCHEGAREGAVDLVEFAGHFPISPYLILIFGFFFFLSFIYQGVCSCCPGLVFIDK